MIPECLNRFRLQAQESMLAQSQKCVQELTGELRNRCLELRELSYNMQDHEKLLQVRRTAAKKNKNRTEHFFVISESFVKWLDIIIYYFLGSISLICFVYLFFYRRMKCSASRMFNCLRKMENWWGIRTTNRGLNIWWSWKGKTPNFKRYVTSLHARKYLSFFI